MTVDDLALARAAAQGDSEAVGLLLERHLPELRAFVRLRAGPIVRERESTSDVVQSVCREVLERIDDFRFPSETAFRRWLFTTALRKLSDRKEYWTAQKRDGARMAPKADTRSEAVDERLLACYHALASASGVAILREQAQRLELAFDRLPEEYREVITLARVVGLSRAEIGAQMGKSEGAVRMLLARALAELAELLSPDA